MSPSSRRPTARLPLSSVISPFLFGGFFVLTVLLAGLVGPAEAAVTYFYVSPQGSDNNPGTREAPWQTLQHTAEAAKPGDTVRVMKGTYEPFTISNKGRHFDEGSAQNQTFLTIQPDLGVQPYEVIVEGNGAPACVTVSNSDSVIVSGMTLNNCQQGIRNSGSTNTTFRNLVLEESREVDCVVYVTSERSMGCDGRELDLNIPPEQAGQTPEPQTPAAETPQAEQEQETASFAKAPEVAAASATPRKHGGAAPFGDSKPNVAGPSSRKECATLPITVSNYQEGNPPAFTRDNNLNTRWSMDGIGQWIQFDLGKVTPLGQVGIAWLAGDQRTAKFDVDISADGATWYRVFKGASSGKTQDIEIYDFQAPDSRYVRLVNEGNSWAAPSDDWMSITEVAFDQALPASTCDVQAIAQSPGVTQSTGLGQINGVCNGKPTTRLGLFFTKEEVEIWKQRAQSGPYKSKGDVSANSPGDWDRIVKNANDFLRNPHQDHFKGQAAGQCLQNENAGDPGGDSRGNGGSVSTAGWRMADAGFYYLITGDKRYADAVRGELLSQAKEPGVNFWDAKRFCIAPYTAQNSSYIEYPLFLMKALFAYDYVKDTMTPAERAVMDNWLKGAGHFFNDYTVSKFIKSRFPNRDSATQDADYKTPARGNQGAIAPLFYGGPVGHVFNATWNNTRADAMAMVGLVGLMVGDQELQISAKKFFKETIMFGVYPQGAVIDFFRNADNNYSVPCKGWQYSDSIIREVMLLADAYARAGDAELYNYSTTHGFYGSEGADQLTGQPKSLHTTILALEGYVDGRIKRYGTDKAGNVGNKDYQIGPVCKPYFGSVSVNDMAFALANVYFKAHRSPKFGGKSQIALSSGDE